MTIKISNVRKEVENMEDTKCIIKYTKEDIDRISGIIFNEVKYQVDWKNEEALEETGKENLFTKVKIKISNTFYHREEYGKREIFLDQECVNVILRRTEEKLTEAGYTFYNTHADAYEGKDKSMVYFELMVCKYKLKAKELHKLIKEEKRSSFLLDASMIGLCMNAISEVFRKEKPKTTQEKLSAAGLFALPPLILYGLSRITPVKRRLTNKYVKFDTPDAPEN